MNLNRANLPATSALLLGALAAASACGRTDSVDEGCGSGGAEASGGSSTGSAGTGGTGTGGADCPNPTKAYVGRPAEGGASGEGGAASEPIFYCRPEVCLGAYLPIRDRFPLAFAFTNAGSTEVGTSGVFRPYDQPDIEISTPDPTRICAKGSRGATLFVALGVGEPADTLGEAFAQWRTASWQDLGITQFRFKLETPPTPGLDLGMITFPHACDEGLGFVDARVDGKPLLLSEDGRATTLSLDSNFKAGLDPSTLGELAFGVPAGDYDFCIKDLEFLDEDGNPVTE